MFNLFRRTKIKDWEIDFLKTVFSKISNEESQKFDREITEGLLRGVILGMSDIKNYTGFTYNSSVHDKFYNSKGKNYKLSNIIVKDILSDKFLTMSIYIAYDLIIGYSIDENISKYKLDIETVDVSSIKKIYIRDDNSLNIVLPLLTKQEKDLINESDIYPSLVNGKEYYHLKELEDGDFIGIDKDNCIYRITHDPLEAILLERKSLVDILNG